MSLRQRVLPRKKRKTRFTCDGCGQLTSGQPLIYTNPNTNKKSRYCGECDDKLIQDLPLSLAKGRRND